MRVVVTSPYSANAFITPPETNRPWEKYNVTYCVLVGDITSNCTTKWVNHDSADPGAEIPCKLTDLQPSTTYRIWAWAQKGTAIIVSDVSDPNDFTTLTLS